MNDHETMEAAGAVMRTAIHLLTILEKCLPEDNDAVTNATTRMAVIGMMIHITIMTLPKGDTREGAVRYAEKFGEIMLGAIEKHHFEENGNAPTYS